MSSFREVDDEALLHEEIGIRLHRELDVEACDAISAAIGGERRGHEHARQQQQQKKKKKKKKKSSSHDPSSTRGAAASLRSSSEKNSRSRNPSERATTRAGNDWMRVFRSRTIAL